MVLHYLLGAIDIIGAISFGLLSLGFSFPAPLAATGVALIGKGILFIDDFLSIIDIIIGICALTLIWIDAPVLALALAIYLACKGAYTFT